MYLLLIVALATSVSQFQIDARSESGSDTPEIREAIARALVAGGMRVILGGKDQDCDRCARVSIVEIKGGTYEIQVDQDRRHASSLVRLAIDTPLLDKARALAVQVRLLTKPAPRPAIPRHTGTKVTPALVTVTTEPLPIPDLPKPTPMTTVVPAPASPPAIPVSARPAIPSEPASAKPAAPVDSPALAAKADPPRLAGETPRWPYIPLSIGVAAGISAAVCGLLARDRYDALANRNWSLAEARSLKSQGENLQVAGVVLGGTAVVGSLVAWVGFSKKGKPYRPAALATADGMWVGVVGELP